MAEKHLKKCSTSLIIRKCKSKQPWDSTSHQSEWLRSKNQVTVDAGEDVEKEKHSSIDGGTASWSNHSGNQFDGSSENWTKNCWKIQQYLSWAYTQKMLWLVIRTHATLCSNSLIYNHQKLERTQMSHSIGMDTKKIVHLHNGVLLRN